jgi:hypothetical protein
MSFGFSIGDIISLVQVTSRSIEGWNSACGRYATVTEDLINLQHLLQRIEDEAKAPDSLLLKNAADAEGWKHLFKSCQTTVAELDAILIKYKSLGTNRRKNWDRIRLGTENLDHIHAELVKKTSSLSAFVSVLGLSSQGRIENTLLPELIRKVDQLVVLNQKGTASVNTAWTDYVDDDKDVWREFTRDLRSSGFSGSVIHQHRAALKTYLARLQREGKLDEDSPVEEEEEAVHSAAETVRESSPARVPVTETSGAQPERTNNDVYHEAESLAADDASADGKARLEAAVRRREELPSGGEKAKEVRRRASEEEELRRAQEKQILRQNEEDRVKAVKAQSVRRWMEKDRQRRRQRVEERAKEEQRLRQIEEDRVKEEQRLRQIEKERAEESQKLRQIEEDRVKSEQRAQSVRRWMEKDRQRRRQRKEERAEEEQRLRLKEEDRVKEE